MSIGSDCHEAHYAVDLHTAGDMLESVGIRDGFWRLPPRDQAP
jgi:hypothetical protein